MRQRVTIVAGIFGDADREEGWRTGDRLSQLPLPARGDDGVVCSPMTEEEST